MATASDYEQRVCEILGIRNLSEGLNMKWSWTNEAEAKQALARIRHLQKELRLVKKEASAHISEIRSAYVDNRATIGKTAGSAFAAGLFGRKAVGRSNATLKATSQREQQKALEPFESVNRSIEKAVLGLDGIKLQIEEWVLNNKAS